MNKKWILGVLMGCMLVQSVSIIASTEVVPIMAIVDSEKIEEKSQVTVRTGEVTSVVKRDDIYEIMVGEEMEGVRFLVKPGVLVLDSKSLSMKKVEEIEKGMQVTVVLDQHTPMTLSIPPICSEQIAIIVNDENKNTEVGFFDENLVNERHTLKLNIGENTIIQNTKGERRVFTAEDIKNHDAIVIYTASTRSIPAQTTPEYVMIIERKEEVDEIKEDTIIEERGARSSYVAVRELAEQYGYELEWVHESKTVVLTKEEKKLELTVGKVVGICNGEEIALEGAITIEENTVYAPSLLEEAL